VDTKLTKVTTGKIQTALRERLRAIPADGMGDFRPTWQARQMLPRQPLHHNVCGQTLIAFDGELSL